MGRKDFVPPSVPDGYVCKACSKPGHWVYDCAMKKKSKKRKRVGDGTAMLDADQRAKHRDPTAEDIAKAQADMPVIRMSEAPLCQCGLKAAPRKNRAPGSPGFGMMFWWCRKNKDNTTRCAFAAPFKNRTLKAGGKAPSQSPSMSSYASWNQSDSTNTAQMSESKFSKAPSATEPTGIRHHKGETGGEAVVDNSDNSVGASARAATPTVSIGLEGVVNAAERLAVIREKRRAATATAYEEGTCASVATKVKTDNKDKKAKKAKKAKKDKTDKIAKVNALSKEPKTTVYQERSVGNEDDDIREEGGHGGNCVSDLSDDGEDDETPDMRDLIKRLKAEMTNAVKRMDFESAAALRDQIAALR